ASSWVATSVGSPIDFSGITHGHGNFVAVGGSAILTSPNGVAWSMQNSETTNALYAVSFGGGQFVAAGAGVLLTSTNATNWITRDLGTNPATLHGAAYGNGTFTAVGGLRSSTSAILTSADVTNWTSRTSGILDQVYHSVAFGDGRFVAVGLQDSLSGTGAIARSPDGVTWTRSDSLPTANL